MFYLFAILAVLSALGVIYFRNLLYVAFSLLVTLLSLAGIFVLLFADFVAVTQLMVYVGGVLVLILFGIMLSSKGTDEAPASKATNKWGAALVGLLVLGGLAYLILQVQWQQLPWLAEQQQLPVAKTTLPAVGINLMTTFVLPFEVASLLLLIALIGAAHISTRKHD